MAEAIKQYVFKESNKVILIFLPGYSEGLRAPIIEALINSFIDKGDVDVLGIDIAYKDDNDLFDKSQNLIIKSIKYLFKKYPHKQIYIVAKSLGGSLGLFSLKNLPVKGLIILGFPVILGWPQRISLLSSGNPTIPNYRIEWRNILEALSMPTIIITGNKDDLADNNFLLKEAKINSNLQIIILAEANHSLQNINTNKLFIHECVKAIEDLVVLTRNNPSHR